MPRLNQNGSTAFCAPRGWFLCAVFLGIAWRLINFALNSPIWSDEAAVLMNLAERSYAELQRPLDYGQVAPLLYLVVEKWIMGHFGTAEGTLRLSALIPGLLAIPVFYLLARAYGGRYAPMIAVALLSVSVYPVHNAVMVKPYALDLLVSATLLLIGVNILKYPSRLLPILALALLAPVAFFISYPAIFIVAAVILAIVPSQLRRGSVASRLLIVISALATLATFLAYYHYIGQGQFKTTHAIMEASWEGEFPPLDYRLPWWLLRAHLTGMMSYPMGGKYGSALLIFPLSILGAIRIWTHRSRSYALLLVLPFFMTFLASIPHRYPYGGFGRVEQHLVPCILLLTAHGFMALLSALWRRMPRRGIQGATARASGPFSRIFFPHAVAATLAFYSLFALVNIAIDLRKADHPDNAQMVRDLARRIFTPDTPPDQQVVIAWNGWYDRALTFYFHIQPHLVAPRGKLLEDTPVDEALLRRQSAGRLWLIAYRDTSDQDLPAAAQQLMDRGFKLSIVEHTDYPAAIGPAGKPLSYRETMCLNINGPPTPATATSPRP